MKINWFSPLPPAKTDIAHYTARILPELASRADVVLWTDQEEWDPVLEKYAKVVHFKPDQVDWFTLNQADISFYNIGNNAGYHSGIWQVSSRCPGIVVLHEYRLQHLFAGMYFDALKEPDGYRDMMVKCYGPECLPSVGDYLTQRQSLVQLSDIYPLAKYAVRNALGVMTHSQCTYELEEICDYSRCYHPLPYVASHPKENRPGVDSEKLRLIVFGYIGENRRLDTVLKALADLPNKAVFRLDVYGEILEKKRISKIIDDLDLRDLVTLKGFVPEQDLDAALSKADMAINLRYPTMGESSGSQMRIWDHALPSMVTRIGWYATLPEDVVSFVDVHNEIEDIQRHLAGLMENPEIFAEKGKLGRRLLVEQHDPAHYAQTAVAFAQDLLGTRYQKAVIDFTATVGGELSRWLSHDILDETADSVSATTFETFASHASTACTR